MKIDIGLVFKYILAIIIPLIVYFGIGWIAKDIYFSIWEIVDSTTLEEIYNKRSSCICLRSCWVYNSLSHNIRL